MFEFETKGNVNDLKKLEEELLEFLGFGDKKSYQSGQYEELAKKYKVKELGAAQEKQIFEDFGPVFFLTKFPHYTSPFWNMKMVGNYANKIDVILYGIETIGSAERSTDPKSMRHNFHTISQGMYANLLYAQFTKERVEQELEKFLSLKFFSRCGGGIGITRMIRALKLAGILK